MSHLLREFFRFTLSVFGHWQTWLSGSGIGGFIVIAVGLVEKLFGAGLSKKQYVYLFVVSFFLCSCFLAWVDSDDALRTEHEARQTEHSGDLAQLQNAKDQYGELNGKCQYQAGVTDTLRKQNGDQQNSINNCQNQALKLLSPEPTKVEFLQLEKDRAAGESFESTFIIITNRSLSPITLTFDCTKDFTGMNIWPLSPTRAMPITMGAHPTTLRHVTLDVSTPALTPSNPFFVEVMHKSKDTVCSLQV